MIHLGANSVLFAGFDLETAMRHIHLAGYDGVELSAIKGMCEHLELDNWQAQANQIKELAEKYELKITGYGRSCARRRAADAGVCGWG